MSLELSANDPPPLTDPTNLTRQPAGCLACFSQNQVALHRQKKPRFRGVSVACLCVEESLIVIIIRLRAQYPTSHPDSIPDLRFLIG